MLTIRIGDTEIFDENTNEFKEIKGQTLQLEHSLVSISKWESKWNRAFLGKEEKTPEQILDYIRCMTITQNVKPDIYNYLTVDQIKTITDYIEAPMTATWFSETEGKGASNKGETITSELIYYWMIALQIPVEFQKWHLNRLLTLIRVCNIKNTPPKKMSKKDIMTRNRSLNEARKNALNTRG